jgi:hypothetical protein
MSDQALVEEFLLSGRVTEREVVKWGNVAGLMAVFDAIGREGVSAVVKIDGGRLDGALYTVVVSGSRLGDSFFRQDGNDLAALLRDAIEFYKEAT